MRKGRKPKPTKLKLVADNPGKRELNEDEPEPAELEFSEPPAHLSPEAAAKWYGTVEILSRNHVFTEMDIDLLSVYCVAWADWLEAKDKIDDVGKIIKAGKSGYPMLNPYVVIKNQAEKTIQSVMSEFGMGPASRSRVKVIGKKKSNDKKAKARRLLHKG